MAVSCFADSGERAGRMSPALNIAFGVTGLPSASMSEVRRMAPSAVATVRLSAEDSAAETVAGSVMAERPRAKRPGRKYAT